MNTKNRTPRFKTTLAGGCALIALSLAAPMALANEPNAKAEVENTNSDDLVATKAVKKIRQRPK